MKWITVFTDASFDHITQAAGIAMWWRDSEMINRKSKAITFPVDNSGIAESIALGVGILKALEMSEPGDRLSIQSDNLDALRLYTASRKHTAIENDFMKHVLQEVSCAGITLHPKHVKGHMGNISPRHSVNTWCDKAAKRAMRKARAILSMPKISREDVLKEIRTKRGLYGESGKCI